MNSFNYFECIGLVLSFIALLALIILGIVIGFTDHNINEKWNIN